MRHWFLPETPDVLGLLEEQGRTTVAGVDAFAAWAHGEAAKEAEVREAEHRADDASRAVLTAVRRAFVSPVAPEDVLELSERLDAVLNDAKNLVREAELLALPPDEAIAEMADLVAGGVRELVDAFRRLVRDPDGATELADRAVRRQRKLEHVYRRAMSDLLDRGEPREVTSYRELYRRCARMGDAVEHVARRVWYAVVKDT